jgi:hypothetical protein
LGNTYVYLHDSSKITMAISIGYGLLTGDDDVLRYELVIRIWYRWPNEVPAVIDWRVRRVVVV